MDISGLLGRSWQQLTLEEQEALAALFGTPLGVPVVASFTNSQQEFLSTLFLDVSGQEAEIAAITAQIMTGVVMQSVETADGRSVVPASLLTDPANYGPYLAITTTAPLVQLSLSDFPQSEFPGGV